MIKFHKLYYICITFEIFVTTMNLDPEASSG